MANLASNLHPWWLLPVSFLLVSNIHHCVNAEPQVPCYFIFGDSLSDSGNNNNLATTAKVNYSPYGIDFPKGPTGRFTNGRTMQDIIVQLLGFQEFIPPFATSKGRQILKGVNYASGSSGILNESGQQLGDRVCMNKQLSNHQSVISTIAKLLGKRSASKLLRKCIYAVQIGSNDYINNYFKPEVYNTSRLFSPEQYAAYLIEQYSRQLKTLYNNGARKLAVFGVGSIGCTPNAMVIHGTDSSTCVEKLNNAAQLFNERLISLVDELNTNLRDAKFTYLNPTGATSTKALGFTVINAGCCRIGSDGELCLPGSEPCGDRSKYVFWDAVHTSDAWNEIIAEEAYGAESSGQAYPLNINKMAQLHINNDADEDICGHCVI
ncbi:GDSL esterase/lipase [Hibiscus syriacus]|uniref:GDSL esterase/lipase n=1 Tax=Hibiscus syriacus TaxID=106335 RepID=A0A6A3B9U5_HIBSY|nr:GDSL esterase/lipase At1g29670-like [Hibiscus syriacus]KAE8713820.1 GDSL esterase/lipase [Hibiscus syriacus]